MQRVKQSLHQARYDDPGGIHAYIYMYTQNNNSNHSDATDTTYISMYVDACRYMCVHTRVYMYMYKYVHICIDIYTYIQLHACIYIHTYIHV